MRSARIRAVVSSGVPTLSARVRADILFRAVQSLLPPNASDLEIAIDGATARVGAVPLKIGDLWNPERCPAAVLPWLAWALSVDYWRSDWPEDVKRRVIAEAIPIHFKKGSVSSIRRALQASGYADAQITERVGNSNPQTDWAKFSVNLDIGEDQTVTVESLRQARLLVESVAPVSRHLESFTGFRATTEEAVGVSDLLEFAAGVTIEDQVRVNGGINHDGSVNYDGNVGYESERDQMNVRILEAA